MNKLEKTLIQNYKNPSHPTAFSGIQNVYKYYKKQIPLRKVKEILSKIKAYTIHREYKNLQSNPNYVNYARQQFQIDIAYFDHLAIYNDGIKYLLICIDAFTKFAFVRPMKDKTNVTTLKNFISILNQARKHPKNVLSDRGSEFLNQNFLNYCRNNDIKMINNYTSVHAPIAERYIRTLKKIITTYLTANNTKRYIDKLQDLVQSYNTRRHSSIKMSPYEAEKPTSAFQVRTALSKLRKNIRKKPVQYKVGQKVRIALERRKFSRGHDPKFSEELFTIYMIKTKLPIPIYYVEDENKEKISGGFYGYELTPVSAEQ